MCVCGIGPSAPQPTSLTRPHSGPHSFPWVPGQYPRPPLAFQGPRSLSVLRLSSSLSTRALPPASRRPWAARLDLPPGFRDLAQPCRGAPPCCSAGPGSCWLAILIRYTSTVCHTALDRTDISWTSGWKDGWTDRLMGRRMGVRVDGYGGSERIGRQVDGWILHRWTDGWVD